MKNFFTLVLLATGALLLDMPRASAETNAAKQAAATTNSVFEIPKSVFDEQGGKDPFFPRRTLAAAAVPKATTSAISASDFRLKAVTPFGPKPTATINGSVFEKDESAEVKVPSGGRILIRCIEIKEDSVLIQVNNSPQKIELRMRPDF